MAILLENGKIFIGTGEVIEGGTVAIHDHLIAFVGPARKVRSSKQDTSFDISGKVVLPGLIDTHVHLCIDGSPDPMTSLSKDSIPQLTLKTAQHAGRTLEAGVTTVRDMGGRDYVDIAIRDEIESGLLQGPRILQTGEIQELVSLKLSLVGLAGFEDYYPSEISGGMRKRAGLARAMALDPDILFFDEPSAGLDPISARLLDDLILELRDSLGSTIVVVTHELASIFAIDNNSVFLDADTKTMTAEGNPKKLLAESQDPKIRAFLTRGEEGLKTDEQ